MSWKSESVSMPMASAGILGISQGEVLEGIRMDPKTIVIGIVIFVTLIKVLGYIMVKV
jgi:preprotein translocase subunit Sec61beta